MIYATCIQKINGYNSNGTRLKGYTLTTSDGNTFDISSADLKRQIRYSNILVDNLTLTSDNRLISTKPRKIEEEISYTKVDLGSNIISQINVPKHLSFKTNVNIDNLLNKVQLLGDNADLRKIKNNLFILETADNLTVLTDLNKILLAEDASFLFSEKDFKSIDMTNLDTSNTTNFKYMFAKCKSKQINLSNIDTSNATCMDAMFQRVRLQSLDLSNFNTKKLKSMYWMFREATINHLNLHNFNTKHVTEMQGVFESFKTTYLDVSSFDTSRVKDCSFMFSNIQIDRLDISNFRYKKCQAITRLFENSEINTLCIGDFDIRKITRSSSIFLNSHINNLITNKILVSDEIERNLITKEVKSFVNNWEEVIPKIIVEERQT